MVFGRPGFLGFEDSLGASNMGFVKCKKTIGFCRPGLLTFEDSLGGSNTDLAQKLGFVAFAKVFYEKG